MDPDIHVNTLVAFNVAGLDVGRVSHAALGAKDRHGSTQTFGPVAGPEFMAIFGDADDDEALVPGFCHARSRDFV